MKLFLSTFIIISFSLQCFAQQRSGYVMWPYGADDKIEFSETINPQGTTGDSLYLLAKSFVSRKFNTDKDSVTIIDPRRTIICKGSIYLPVDELGDRGKGYVGFTLTISCHYRGYRYTLTNLEHFPQNPDGVAGGPLENDRAACGGSLFPMRYWNNEKTKAYYYIQTTIESLKEAMSKRKES